MSSLPALFVSHGAPTLVIEDVPARSFLQSYGATLGRPTAIIVASAHWETALPTLGTADHPPTIHDFGGFDPQLYALRYRAPGAPGLAARAAALLRADGIEARLDPARGLDHGAWVPLMLLYPEADIPVVPLSLQPDAGPDHHRRLGAALRPLRAEGVLILGSGSVTHNLGALRWQAGDQAPAWVRGFEDWIAAAIAAGDDAALVDYRARAPHAADNHPTDEHFLPLFVALGAGSAGRAGRRVHHSHTHGVLGMDAYEFE